MVSSELINGKNSSIFETIGVPITDCIIIRVIVSAVNIEIKTPMASVIAKPWTNGASKVPNIGNSIIVILFSL